MYYMTPNIDLVFLQAYGGEFQLWKPEQGCILKFSGSGEATSLAVNKEGTLLATAYEENDYRHTMSLDTAKHWAEVRSAENGEIIQEYKLPAGYFEKYFLFSPHSNIPSRFFIFALFLFIAPFPRMEQLIPSLF